MNALVSDRQVWVDRFFAATWERARSSYVQLWLVVSASGIVFLAWPAQYFTEKALWGPSPHDHAFLVAMASGVAITVVTQAWAARSMFGPIIAFARRRPVAPELVWYAAVRRMPRVSIICTASYCFVGNIAVLATVGPARHFSAVDYVGAWLLMALITSAAGFFFVLIWEVALRPVLREVQPLLRADFAPGSRFLTLSRRSAIASASAMAYTGAAVSCFVAATDNRDDALRVAVLGTMAVSVTFGGVITALVSHSIFVRVSDLKAALVRIGDRDYDVRVAVRAGDELDEAGLSLNRMAERLRRDDLALRASRARLAFIADAERRRMGRDLRHHVLARLHALDTEIDQLGRELADDPDLHRHCAHVRVGIADAVSEIRRLALGVYPADLTEAGLATALKAAAERATVPTTVVADGVARFDPALESAVFFCCTEALQNAAKHAGERASVTIALGVADRQLVFTVSDDGRGLPEGADGVGLANMRDRIRAVGGDVSISSLEGHGTTVSGWVPGVVPAPQSVPTGQSVG